MTAKKNEDMKQIARNRKAFHDYEILEKIEAGIELRGTEVKSIRAGRINLSDCYAMPHNCEMFIHHLHISPFEQANRFNHDPYRTRKLLIRSRDIVRLSSEMERKRLSLIPLSVYFRKQWVKVELGLCRGRKKYDKREKKSEDEAKKRIRNIMKAGMVILSLLNLPIGAVFADLKPYGSVAECWKNIPTIKISGCEYVSINRICDCRGYTKEWDSAAEKLICKTGSMKLTFSSGNQFVLMNDSLIQLPLPTYYTADSLYIALPLVEMAFGEVPESSVGYDSSIQTVNIASSRQMPDEKLQGKKNIVAEKKTAGAKNDKSQNQILKTIVIDPGHGGKDPGAIGANGIKEKEVVLSIALKLRDLLKAKGGWNVFCTRETDVFVPLKDRTTFANEKKADLFVSIHVNSIMGNTAKKKQTRGFKIYFLSQAKNEEDKLAAMMENSVIELEDESGRGDYLQNILIDMANSEYLSESEDMSIMIAESFSKKLAGIPALHQGVGQAPFWVLNGAFMPSVLVETAFISNPDEEKLLTDEKFQRKTAEAIFNAILSFKEKYEAEI